MTRVPQVPVRAAEKTRVCGSDRQLSKTSNLLGFPPRLYTRFRAEGACTRVALGPECHLS